MNRKRTALPLSALALSTLFLPRVARAEELRLESFADTMAPITLGFFIACFVAMLLYLIHSIREKPYSYKNAAMVGGLAYLAYVTVFIIIPITALNRRSPDLFMVGLLEDLATSTRYFTDALLPYLIAIFLGLGISNVALIRHEGKSPRNMLGAFLGFGLIAFTFLNKLGWDLFYERRVLGDGSQFQRVVGRILPIFISGLLCYLECVFFGMSFCAVAAARHKPAPDQDFVIIPGCAIRKDGTLFPLLRGRVDRAREIADLQIQKTGKTMVFVPSGGQGADECMSEAEAMKRYLTEQGIPEERVLLEDRSSNTRENMAFSKKVIFADREQAKVAFTTTNYHVFRTGVCATDAGLRAEGTGSKTRWYFWPNAFIREFIALLSARRRSVLVNVLFLLVFSILLGLLDYRF